MSDLREVPGLVSSQSDKVNKRNECVHDRRMVQAVIARNGRLVGITVKEVQFCMRYEAAVIAVQRDSNCVYL
jgi:Trk K+ transport system NAD-binding subunit